MFSCDREPSTGYYIKLYQATLSPKWSIKRDALDMWYLTQIKDQQRARQKKDHHYYDYIMMIILMMTEVVGSELWG